MSNTSELIWVAVPGGIRKKTEPHEVVLRVVIIPRLLGTSLASGGMEHWPPQALMNDTLAIHISRSPQEQGRMVNIPPPHIQAQPGLWEEFFGAGTLVASAQPPSGTMPEVDVANTSEEAKAIKITFDNVARTEVSGNPSADLDPVIRKELGAWRDRPRSSRRSSSAARAASAPAMDFHRSLTLLREHPAVLKALGLIIELKFPASLLFKDPAERVAQVLWPGAGAVQGLAKVISPWTEFGREFLPASTTNIHSGMVTLTDESGPPATPEEARWEIVTVDVENSASRLRNAANALAVGAPAEDPQVADIPTEQGLATLPALRTAGLLLVRKGRQDDFADRRRAAARNAARDSMSEEGLTADELVLGYRIDISRSAQKWLSLHLRSAAYRVNGNTPIAAEPIEEGHIKAHAAVDDGDGSGILRADEVVARWSGWSLSVGQPSFNGQTGRRQPARRAGQPFDLGWEFTVPDGTLPQLRFSSSYRIRARVVDLAGGGLEVDDAAADRCATEETPYRRYEPVTSPDIRLPEGVDATKLDPSESVGTVVIRSDDGSVAAFLSQNPAYHSQPTRVLLPPRVPMTVAEQHGMFDRPEGIDRDTWEQRTWAWIRGAIQSDASGDNLLLPDPAAGGVCIFVRPEPGGFPAIQVPRAWEETWPELKAKQIVLLERPEGVSTTNPLKWVATGSDGDRLEVSLAKAEQVTLEVSCRMTDNFLDHFAIHDPLPTVLESLATSGRHPLVTPARTVTLVHAVRRPLKDPAGSLTPRRELGQTFVGLDPDPLLLNVDPKSTGQVELTAAWTEHHDDVTQAIEGARVQSVTVNRGDIQLRDPLRHEFGDTRHRMVAYTVTAVSRFRSFFHEQGEDPQTFLASTQSPQVVNVRSTARPQDIIVVSTRPALAWAEQVDGSGENMTVRRRRRGGVLRVEMERPWFQTGEGEQLGVLVAKNVAPPESMWQFITQVGRDPIWSTTMLSRWPIASLFHGMIGEPKEQFLEQARDSVMVVPYAPWFHNGRWYADVALPNVADASYCPIVQLAVARYQPNSLPGLELSRMVKTEMVPVLPERLLTVARSGANVTVKLEGLGPTGPQPNRVEAILEMCQLPAGVSPSNVDLIAFEPPTDGTLAWMAVPGQVRRSDLGSGGMQLTIPEGAGAFRVRVREVEQVGSEMGVPLPQTGTLGELSERVIFTDGVLLAEG